MVSDSILFRGYLQRDLEALAGIIADNSTAALAFNDPEAAAETLAALKARTHLEAACIYREDGSILANYARSGSSSAVPHPASRACTRAGIAWWWRTPSCCRHGTWGR